MRVLILGASGQLGSDLIKKIKKVALSQKENKINYFDKSKINNEIKKKLPKIIINCVAYTNVNDANKNKLECKYLNSTFPKILAEICKKNDITLIHFSTDFVFNGKSKKKYLENSKTSPLNYYGKSKLIGDKNIIKSGCKYFIFRISWLYNIHYKNNFINKVKHQILNKDSFTLPEDEIGSPMSTNLLANYINIFIKKLKKKKIKPGIFNLTCNDYTSRYNLGVEISKILKKNHFIAPAKISKIIKKNSVKRPKNSRLNIKKIEKILNLKIYNWKKDLKNNLINN